jgi:hypothetical protein
VTQPIAETAPEIAAPAEGLRRAAFDLDILIDRVAEFIGATLVLAETCILFAGVVSRLRLQQPDHLDRRARHLPVSVAHCSAPSSRYVATVICG